MSNSINNSEIHEARKTHSLGRTKYSTPTTHTYHSGSAVKAHAYQFKNIKYPKEKTTYRIYSRVYEVCKNARTRYWHV